MRNELAIFSDGEFSGVRAINLNGKPFFVGNDIAGALKYARPYEAVTTHCKGAVNHRVLTEGGEQELRLIPESDMYRLIMKAADQSTNPEIKRRAEKFERWIFDDVLPTIRRTGGYVSNDELFVSTYLQHADEQTKTMFRATLETVRKQNEKIAVMEPKADFYDTVASSTDAIDIGTAAKVLKIPGIGRNNLFERLRREKILMANNLPYQEYIDRGYFRVIEQTYTPPGGSPKVKTKTLVYQKGLDYIRRKIERG